MPYRGTLLVELTLQVGCVETRRPRPQRQVRRRGVRGVQPDEIAGDLAYGTTSSEKVSARQAVPALPDTELPQWSAFIGAHRLADLRQALRGRTLTLLVLVLDVAALSALLGKLGLAEGGPVAVLD